MPTEMPLARDEEGYLVAAADLTQGTTMFQRAPVLPVVRELEEFVTTLAEGQIAALDR